MPSPVVHLTMKSANAKTGPIPVSASSASTCPDSCPLKAGGCYAKGGPLGMHWRQVSLGMRGSDWKSFCASIASLPDGQVWRHNQAGDLPRNGRRIDRKALRELVSANAGRRGFTYTHHDMALKHNREAIAEANVQGFTVNLSADNLAEADQLADLAIGPVVTLLPADATEPTQTPAGRRVVLCPVVTEKAKDCASCKLCAASSRRVIIGFPAHGSRKRAADAIAKG